jgi:pimeloyl-ACP methyl ester carboxylesterase
MPYLKLKDTAIYYEVHGSGPSFLFCSVTGLDHQAWKFHQIAEFSRDHRVIVFDYRGTGKSSKTIQQYSIKMFTEDAAALLDHLDAEPAMSAVIPWAVSLRNCSLSIIRAKSRN